MINRIGLVLIVGLAQGAAAQSLFQQSPAPTPDGAADVDTAEPLYNVSLIAVPPKEPRTFAINDLVTIVINERSNVKREQAMETEKDYEIRASHVLPQDLLKYMFTKDNEDDVTDLSTIRVGTDVEFNGEGEYERKDNISGKLTARVIDVKPNGTLLLEAKTMLQTDEEVQTFLLSGLCRTEDINEETGEVESNRLYDLKYTVRHSGQMKNATKKGIFPRLFETLFNF